MKKVFASLFLCGLMIMLTAAFVVSADAQSNPGTNVPSAAGFSSPGTFRQGMQTGSFGQGPAGGIAGGISPYQQPGQGIAIGEPVLSGPARGQSCYCIRAPCICPGSAWSDMPSGGPSPYMNPYNQPIPAPAGQFVTAAPVNVAGTGEKFL